MDGVFLDAAAVGEPCELHKLHTPKALTIEFHHLIPVAWQLLTAVTKPPSPGPDPNGRGQLWDDRGAWLCPSGHRNVHYWIVRMMHLVAALPARAVDDPDADMQAAWHALSRATRRTHEAKMALEGLTRFVPYGSLRVLVAAHQYGQA